LEGPLLYPEALDLRRHLPARTPYLAALVAAFTLLYAQVFVDMVKNWIRDPNYSHGFVILPISAYLVWLRRDRIAAVVPNPNPFGLLVVAISLVTLLVGTAGVEYFLMRTSAIGVVVGAVLYFGGTRLLRVLAFPLAFSLLMIPLPAIVFYRIAFPLQLLATRFGVSVLQLAHIPVLREGNVIQLAHTTLEVAEACSGIRSLVSLFSLALLYGYFAATRATVRAVIAASSVPIAIVANGLRVAGTGIAANYVGPAAASGFFHTFSGWLVFAASFLMLATIASALRGLRVVASRVSA
jgi:exosortase